MSATEFLDTNVLAYAYDIDSPDKQRIAENLIGQANFAISTQVLGELYVTLTRKLPHRVSAANAKKTIDELWAFPTVLISPALVTSAIETSIRCQLSYWDALIVEAAVASGCTTLLTEDLSDGLVIKGVTVVNPFRALGEPDQPQSTA